ncbi:unnamed protein product [Leptosia nina]|uniref:Hamartin n=1 Tax=Leptosia nina TaxID=320188 RepID=A0AAV1IZY4_9NEOP
MLTACEAGEIIALLEGRDALDTFASLFTTVREPWLVRGLLAYHARTGSARALQLLARAPDAHARHLLDALAEQLHAERLSRHHALAALAPLLARRPVWLHRFPAHPASRDLLRAARRERDPPALLHALLALAALLPAEPTLAATHWPELTDALLRPAALEPPPAPPVRDHLQLAQLALFHALYATYPCTLVEMLRAECATGAGPRDLCERALAPLLRSVRLHPHLVTGSRQREADPSRWTRLEVHDVLAEARRMSSRTRDHRDPPDERASCPALEPAASFSPVPGSGAHVARAASGLRPGAEPWFPLVDRCGAESAPNTPLPAEPEPVEPPEAAVEATPENTPAKETRTQFRFPSDSGAVRAIGRRSQPPSPLRKESSPPVGAAPSGGDAYVGRLARVALERRAAESPVPFGACPPSGAALPRPEPSRASASTADLEPLNVEDREVLELTQRARADSAWGAVEAGGPVCRDPRISAPPPTQPCDRRTAGTSLHRPNSCTPRVRAVRTCEAAVQTVDTWPEPYEFLIADFFRALPDEERKQITNEKTVEAAGPCERLDQYLTELYTGRRDTSAAELTEQLALVHAQLMYERWRREAHAERNRRLLGRCRRTRILELQYSALRDRLGALQRERDELASRPHRDPPQVTPGLSAVAAERERRLEMALAEETAAKLRAEAALKEAEAQRALDAAELRRSRGESFETARHVEALARAALAAERRAEHVRRLRRELLVLAEREARLTGAVRSAASGGGAAGIAEAERMAGEERALKAALTRAESEAEAACARAEAAAARAHELENALAVREAAVLETKRVARHAAEEHATRLRALQDKYGALLRVVRAGEAHRLERLAGERGGVSVAGAAPPAIADCARVRHLLDRDDEDVPERS